MMRDRFGPDGSGPTADTPNGAKLAPQTACPDFVFDALAEERRRAVCRVLDEEGPRDLEDLALDIATAEYTTVDRDVTNAERENVYMSLYHHHVPKLASLDVVTVDSPTVVPGERFAQVVAALEAVETALDGPVTSRGIDG